MLKKTMSLLLALAMTLALIPGAALAADRPTSFSAPINVGATLYMYYPMMYVSLTAPKDIRDVLYQTDEERGYTLRHDVQLDVNLDNGGWQHTGDWDGDQYRLYCWNGNNQWVNRENLVFGETLERQGIANKFPALKDALTDYNGWAWFQTHTLSVRARFVMIVGDDVVFSDWSQPYVLSHANKMDYQKILLASVPVVRSATMTNRKDVPWLYLDMDLPSDDLQKLNAATANAAALEVYIKRAQDKDYVLAGTFPRVVSARPGIDMRKYFEKKEDYSGEAFSVKVRYALRVSTYLPSGYTDGTVLYSPYSGSSAFTASTWAQENVQKASGMDLIPEALKGADLTRPITRAEFAAVCVKVYENLTGETTTPASPNPFADTSDAEVLKAYNFGLMAGVAADKFDPAAILNREQAATGLTNVLKRAYIPDWQKGVTYTLNFAQPAKFADDARISYWARPSVYFMVSAGVISGTGNNLFAPNASTSAEKAAGYASATREQALILGVKIVENLKGKKLNYTEEKPAAALTLADIVKAAQTAGYDVGYDEISRSLTFDNEYTGLTDRCSINIVIRAADGTFSLDQILRIYECKTAADAQANAKVQTSGVFTRDYLVSDNFFIPYTAQKQATAQKALSDCLAAILKGKPLKAADLLSV